jgi:translocation protein SEC62
MWSNVATVAVIAIVIIFTLLPIWPAFAKKILWYISVTFLLVLFVFLMIRLLCFIVLWIVGYEFWIFPRLFDESLGVLDSFKPTFTFEKGASGQGLYRVGMLVLLTAFVVWAATQPTEFDGFLQAQKEFVDDLYSGNLLSDIAAHKEHLEQLDRSKRFPKIDQLLREMEEDEKEEASSFPTEQTDVDGEDSTEHDNDNTMDEAAMEELLNTNNEEGTEERSDEDETSEKDL